MSIEEYMEGLQALGPKLNAELEDTFNEMVVTIRDTLNYRTNQSMGDNTVPSGLYNIGKKSGAKTRGTSAGNKQPKQAPEIASAIINNSGNNLSATIITSSWQEEMLAELAIAQEQSVQQKLEDFIIDETKDLL